jgi:hypothetical protein
LSACSVNTNVDATGAAPASTSHLAITVEQVWFAPAADTLPEATSGWYKQTLATPITLDLATLTPGTLISLATDLRIPAGSYSQVHFVLAESTDALTSTAQALGLLYNSQISLVSSTGVVSDFALELPVPESGITIPVSVDLTASLGSLDSSSSSSTSTSTSTTSTTSTTSSSSTGTTSTVTTRSVAASIDAARDVVTYGYGANTGYILSPITTAIDESKAGAISGTVDKSALVAGGPPVWVSAEAVDSTGTHHVIVARQLIGTDGSFVLYPLPATKSSKTYYDVVVSCASADTVIIKSVPVVAGAASASTSIQSTTIPLSVAPTVYADVSASNATLPGGARVTFYQTVDASGEIPYAIDGTAVDPITRRLPGDAFALSAGPQVVGTYTSGDAISFTTLAPAEGDGGYVPGSEGLFRTDTLAGTATRVSGTAGAPTEVLVPAPAVAAGGITGTLAVSLSSTAGSYDSGFLVVSSGDRIVETAAVGSALAAGGGSVTLSLPAGDVLAPPSGIPYQVAVRAWRSSDPTSTLTRVAGPNSVNLGDSAAASLSIEVP